MITKTEANHKSTGFFYVSLGHKLAIVGRGLVFISQGTTRRNHCKYLTQAIITPAMKSWKANCE
jgi:hypothetical protein